jgi:hypothetical protein
MHDSYVQLYKGKYFTRPKYKNVSRVIAFDLDETLGSFADLDILWTMLKDLKISVNFNDLLDLYPEFLRYGIMPILEYLYQKKKSGQCNKIYIYTNNQCDISWPSMISDYFDYKLHTDGKLFDKIIFAFKINNKQIELSRTTHEKTHGDFIKCTLLPKTTEICFIDNSEFDNMKTDRIYYIQPASYYHNLSYYDIINRFIVSPIGKPYVNLKSRFIKHFDNFRMIRSSNPNIDVFVAHKIMYHIKEFFYLTNKRNRTKKIRFSIGSSTRKKRN